MATKISNSNFEKWQTMHHCGFEHRREQMSISSTNSLAMLNVGAAKRDNGFRWSFVRFFSMVWGDRFIITPSEFFKEKWTLYCAPVIIDWQYLGEKVHEKKRIKKCLK